MNREPEQRDEIRDVGPETATLRLLASRPVRAGLEQRVRVRLRNEADRRPAVWWRMPAAAGAACCVALLAWGVHAGMTGRATGRAATPQATLPSVAPVPVREAGSFGTAGSMRVPPTLKPLHVPEPPRRGSGQTKTTARPTKPKAALKQATDGGATVR